MQVSIDATGRITFGAPRTASPATTMSTPVTMAATAMAAAAIAPGNDLPSTMAAPTPPPVQQRCKTIVEPAPSLLQLEQYCLLHMMTFLSHRDLSCTALTCQRCNELRNDDSLDQARMHILCFDEVVAAVSSPQAHQALLDRFAGNYTMCYLYFTGQGSNREQMNSVGYQPPFTSVTHSVYGHPPFTSITHLVVPPHPGVDKLKVVNQLCHVFDLLPNIRYADIGSFADWLVQYLRHCQDLHTLRCFQGECINGHEFLGDVVNLFIPQCILPIGCIRLEDESDHEQWTRLVARCEEDIKVFPPHHLLNGAAPRLQKVDLKGVQVGAHVLAKGLEPLQRVRPISQGMLIMFVRRNGPQSLRWFSSDLTAENVAILQAEFPHITFV